jgi:hypothetical protein
MTDSSKKKIAYSMRNSLDDTKSMTTFQSSTLNGKFLSREKMSGVERQKNLEK